MTEKENTGLSRLETGYRFPPSSPHLDADAVAAYLAAVEDANRLYQDDNITPPLAIAACAMKALFDDIGLPAGTIHISQELEFTGVINTGESLTSQAIVKRRQTRGKLDMLTIGFEITNQQQRTVLTGETSLILPASEAGER